MKFNISGNTETTLLENRIYNSSTLFAAITIFIGFVEGLIFHYPMIFNFILCLTFCICLRLYYLGRFKKEAKSYKMLLLIIVVFTICLSWFYNEGIRGSTSFYFFLATISFLYMYKDVQYFIILLFFILFAVTLVLIQYITPESIIPYISKEVQFFDIWIIFITMLFITGYAAIIFKRNLDSERNTIRRQNDKIEIQNIVLKQKNEDLFKAKEKAEESDRLKSAFLANMSHEIRTPMNGILGFADLLKEPHLSDEQQQSYINIIEKSGLRMLNIINDIVDISKIEAGLMNVNIKETDINEKIKFIYIFFKPQVEEKGMQLLFKNTLPAKEATIRTDSEKVYSILTNLVKNAIKYSEEGAIEFGYIKRNKTLEFHVKDTGIGIPKDRQEAIFERFIQADIFGKMTRQGAGLGLSISKAYVEMLGGKIWVESEEGFGSTFYFTLPYNAEPEEKKIVGEVVSAQNEKNQIKDLKILIAEDDETSEKLITINVDKFSKEILKARNGFEAVEICQKNLDIDLILMDIQMPVMNGYEATRQIRQFNKAIVIIAQTAYGLAGDRETAIEAGCNDYIAKPINKDELLSLIQKYFKK